MPRSHTRPPHGPPPAARARKRNCTRGEDRKSGKETKAKISETTEDRSHTRRAVYTRTHYALGRTRTRTLRLSLKVQYAAGLCCTDNTVNRTGSASASAGRARPTPRHAAQADAQCAAARVRDDSHKLPRPRSSQLMTWHLRCLEPHFRHPPTCLIQSHLCIGQPALTEKAEAQVVGISRPSTKNGSSESPPMLRGT